MAQSSNALSNPLLFHRPDCIRCLRKKLDALGVVAFFQHEGAWYVGDFESDTPSADAEFQFNYLLQIHVPELIADAPKGIVLNSDRDVQEKIQGINLLFKGYSIIGAPTEAQGLGGVRLAWRSNSQPFTDQDLATLQCFGECPAGCEAFL